jgi:hypothetical protein
VIEITTCFGAATDMARQIRRAQPDSALKMQRKFIPCAGRRAIQFFLDSGRIRPFNPSHKA